MIVRKNEQRAILNRYKFMYHFFILIHFVKGYAGLPRCHHNVRMIFLSKKRSVVALPYYTIEYKLFSPFSHIYRLFSFIFICVEKIERCTKHMADEKTAVCCIISRQLFSFLLIFFCVVT